MKSRLGINNIYLEILSDIIYWIYIPFYFLYGSKTSWYVLVISLIVCNILSKIIIYRIIPKRYLLKSIAIIPIIYWSIILFKTNLGTIFKVYNNEILLWVLIALTITVCFGIVIKSLRKLKKDKKYGR